MEYHNNTLCISARELMAVMTESNYKQLSARGKVEVARRACRGQYALVVFDSLPDKYKAAAREIYPEGGAMQLQKWFRDNYSLDAEARTFFSHFRFDNGDLLPAAKVAEYTVNASVIRAVLQLMANTKALRRAQPGGRGQWDEMAGPAPCPAGRTGAMGRDGGGRGLFQTGVRPYLAGEYPALP